MNTPPLLTALHRTGHLRTLDHALARTLQRLDPATPDDVLAAAALASLAVSQGHAAFDPAHPQQLVDADMPWPATDAWLQRIAASPLVATPTSPDEEAAAAPLVLERTAQGQSLLYLRRYREYERRLAQQLRRIAVAPHPCEGRDPASLPPNTHREINDPTMSLRHPRASGQARSAQNGRRPAPEGRAERVDPWTSLSPQTHNASLAALTPLFQTLFPHTPTADQQANAAALALRRTLLLITGGPGTGKTTTIARLLVLRIAHALQAGAAPPRIALAAPTGRAAERMAESLRRARTQMAEQGVDAALLDALPVEARTLHRLLGTIPDSPRFRHHADNPLPFDIVVVDEASMVDLPLMCKLTEAIASGTHTSPAQPASTQPAPTQLILLGDPDQLPSVEAGDVLSAILAAAGPGDALHPHDAEALQPLLGAPHSLAHEPRRGAPGRGDVDLDVDLEVDPDADLDRHPREGGDPATLLFPRAPASLDSRLRGSDAHIHEAPEALDRHPREGGDPATLLFPQEAKSLDSRLRGSDEEKSEHPPLHGHRIHLHRGWRQSDTLHVAPLAEAVRNGDAPQALALLRSGTLTNVFFHEAADDPLQSHPHLLAHWCTLATHADPAHALREANRLRLLTALREGPHGARGLNARIEAALSGRRIGAPPAWFPGRLLLITQNSYRHGLFNGDVGICLPDPNGTPLAWFPGDAAQDVRAFHPAALPAHESAFAMTVHKAQGSEFDEVWLQLPRTDSRVLSRELLYTAITRARSVLHVAGGAEVIAAARGRHAGRVSGLGWRLGATE
jgi:exodeoxyribonuclease V alpha subunit